MIEALVVGLVVAVGEVISTLLLLKAFRESRTVLRPRGVGSKDDVLYRSPSRFLVVRDASGEEEVLYDGDDLHDAKAVRGANPGSALVADGMNRG